MNTQPNNTTEKLYYLDAYIKSFDALVISCTEKGEYYEAILNRTAFFPNEGGQPADGGFIGSVRVIDVSERGGITYHSIEAPVTEGTSVHCVIDFEKRFIHMQTHSAEHIISGIIYQNFGYNNVGFHINTDNPGCTIDCSGVLVREQISLVEKLANEAVYNNIPIRQIFPDKDELSNYSYRSKTATTENVRLIDINGIDLCACCAPHVSRTGEIGLIKILSAVSHRGGTRITLISGKQAMQDYDAKHDILLTIASHLSVKYTEADITVKQLSCTVSELKKELACIKTEILMTHAESAQEINGNICFITEDTAIDALREVVNHFLSRCNGICAAFSGNDGNGYNYVIASNSENMSIYAKEINTALNGKGGGKPGMIQGSVQATAIEIRAYFDKALSID